MGPEVPPRASLTPDLLERVEAAYRLGISEPHRDLGGSVNLNLLVRARDAPLVVRVHRPSVTPERLSAVQDVRAHVHRCAVPAVVPKTTAEGAGFVRLDDRLVEVEPFVASHDVMDVWDRFTEAFGVLGRLHDAFASYPGPDPIPDPPEVDRVEPERIGGLVAKALQTTDAARLAGLAHDLAARLPEAFGQLEADLELPEGLGHGGFWGDNILFAYKQVVAVLDFDSLAVRERAYDLAHPLFWVDDALGPHEPEPDRWRRLSALLHHYDEHTATPLTQAERRALPCLVARVPLSFVGSLTRLPDLGGAHPRAWTTRLSRAGEILDAREEIAEVLTRDLESG